jgi:hypothetical protein
MGQPTIIFCDYGTTASVTATSTLTGTSAADVLISTEDTYHQPTSTSSYSIVIDAGVALTSDVVAFLGANLVGVTIEVRGSTDNFVSSDVQVKAGTLLTANVNAAYLAYTAASYRYWKFNISGHASNTRIAHICLDTAVDFPYFETDPDILNVTPSAKQLISASGIYVGTNQTKAMRELNLDWGEVTASELAVLEVWAEHSIETVTSFFLIPDQALTDIFFGWLPNGGQFSAPLEDGVYKVAPNKMTTRAA